MSHPRRTLLWAAAGATLIAGVVVVRFATGPDVGPPPEADLSQIDEPVITTKIESYLDAVRARPRSAERWGKLGMVYDIHGFEGPAATCYRQAAALAPRDFRWTYFLTLLLQKTDDAEAGEWFARSLALRPRYGPLLAKYAEHLFETGEFDSAAVYYQRVVELDSTTAHGYFGLGRVAVAQGELETARRYLEQGLMRNYRFGELRLQLAEVYRRQGDGAKAERERTAAAQVPQLTPYPDSVGGLIVREGVGSYWAKERGDAYLQRGNLEQAAAQFREALVHREDADSHTRLGSALHGMDSIAEAVEHHRAAIELEPTQADARANLAEALLALGQTEEAMRHLDTARALDTASIKPELVLSAHFANSGQWSRAFATMREALRKRPNDFQTLGRLAWLYLHAPRGHRDPREALPLAGRAAELTARAEPEVLVILAEAHRQLGDIPGAVEIVSEAEAVARATGNRRVLQMIRQQFRGRWGFGQ